MGGANLKQGRQEPGQAGQLQLWAAVKGGKRNGI